MGIDDVLQPTCNALFGDRKMLLSKYRDLGISPLDEDNITFITDSVDQLSEREIQWLIADEKKVRSDVQDELEQIRQLVT